MPQPPKDNILTSRIVRVLIKYDGWIDIVPGSFKFVSLDFWYPHPIEGEDPIFTGLAYLGFTFTGKDNDRLYGLPTDGIAAVEVLKEGSS